MWLTGQVQANARGAKSRDQGAQSENPEPPSEAGDLEKNGKRIAEYDPPIQMIYGVASAEQMVGGQHVTAANTYSNPDAMPENGLGDTWHITPKLRQRSPALLIVHEKGFSAGEFGRRRPS